MKNKKKFLVCLLTFGCMFLSPPVSQGDGAFDKYGGWTGLKGTKTGAFHVEAIHDRWWIVTPAGNVFWSIGMYSVRMGGIPETGTGRRPYQEAAIKRYGSEREWARVTLLRLKDWGFNTIGDWSAESVFRQGGFVYVFGINLPHIAPNVIAKGAYGYFPDVFDPSFQQSVYASMEKRFKSQPYLIDDPWLLGYFLADEPSWYGSKQRYGALTDDFIALSADRSGKQAWVQFLKTRYEEIGKLNEAWGTQYPDFRALLDIVTLEDNEYTTKDKKAFLKAVALRFSQVLFTTLRTFDPHHMVLGTRPTRTYPEILEAIGEYTDVFGVSHYQLNTGYKIAPDFERQISDLYSYGKKPILLGVLISGQDAGLPYGLVKTQHDRGVSYWRYLAKVASDPRIVGMHWFQYFDPPRKCYDKMAANWGLVNDQDEPYKDAVDLVRQANQMVYAYALGVSHFAPDFDNLFGLEGEQSSEQVSGGNLETIRIPVVNGDFEARDKGWKMQAWKGESKTAIAGEQKHGGEYALKIFGGQEPGWDSVGVAVQYGPNFILKPGLEYKLSAWIKTKDVESFAQVQIKTTSPSGTVVYYKAGGQYGTQDWTKYEEVFTPLEDSKVDYLVVQLVGKGTAWFDDLALEVSAPEGSDYRDFLRQQEETKINVPDIRMLRTRPLPMSNSGFEEGGKEWELQPWKGKPRVGVAWLKGRDSLRALEIKGSAQGWDSVGVGVRNLKSLKLDATKRYIVKAWVRTQGLSDRALLKIKVKYDAGGVEYFESAPVSGSLDWTEIHAIVQLKSAGVIDYLACQLVGSGAAWFDDISLEEIIDE